MTLAEPVARQDKLRGRLRKLTPRQRLFDRLESHVKAFVGGRGCGKTEVGAHYILKHSQPGDPWLIVSPDYNVIEDTTWPTFERVARQTGQWVRGIKSPTPRAWFRPVGGGDQCQAVFRSAEKPDKLRGGNWCGIWFDEASIMCHDAFTFSIPALRWRGRSGDVLVTMTPKGISSWTFNLLFEDVTDEEREILDDGDQELMEQPDRYRYVGGRWHKLRDNVGLVQSHSRENPFLPATYEHDIGMHLSSALKEQELAGEFIELAGLYFKREWFEKVDAVPRVAQRVRYYDRAATKNSGCYSAGVLMARTDNGIYYVEDVKRGQWSYEERNRVILETAREDDQNYGGTVHIWGEQEGGSAGKEVSEQFIKMLAGYPVYVDIVGGKGTKLLDGIEIPHKPKIVRAQGLIAQAEAGNVKIKRASWNSAFLEELAVFGQSDIMDQCVAEGTLIATARGEVPIEDLDASDFAWTRCGLFPIIHSWCTSEQAVTLRLTTEQGRTLEATGNHPVWTEGNGWTWAEDLERGSTLVTGCERRLCTMELSGRGIQKAQGARTACTTTAWPMENECCFTDTCGPSITARSRLSATFTTPTRTPSTTTSRTWSVEARRRIFRLTPSMVPGTLQNNWSTWPRYERRPKSGTDQRMGELGTESTPSRWLQTESQLKWPATTAGRLSRESTGFIATSAAPNAARRCARQGNQSTSELANGVARNLWRCKLMVGFALSPARIASIGPSGRRRVYNLTVDGPPEYFANGILVHNCDAASGAFNKLSRMWTTDPGFTGRLETTVDGSRFGVHLDKRGRR